MLGLYHAYFIFLRADMAEHARNATTELIRNARPERRVIGPVLAPVLLTMFFSSIVSILGGISLISLLRAREATEIKKEIIDTMVTPGEKVVIKQLEQNNGELAQSDIVRKTGLTKVKVHRIIKRLESLGIVKKYPYGLTNKIRLEKRLYEDT